MWCHTDGCINQYCCVYAIYLLKYLFLVFIIIIDIVVDAPGNDKGVVDGKNVRYKRTIKSETSKLLNSELICDDSNLSSSYRFKKKKNIKL